MLLIRVYPNTAFLRFAVFAFPCIDIIVFRTIFSIQAIVSRTTLFVPCFSKTQFSWVLRIFASPKFGPSPMFTGTMASADSQSFAVANHLGLIGPPQVRTLSFHPHLPSLPAPIPSGYWNFAIICTLILDAGL